MTVITSSDVSTWMEFNMSPRTLWERQFNGDTLVDVNTINGVEIAWVYRFGNTNKGYRIRDYGFNCQIIDWIGDLD